MYFNKSELKKIALSVVMAIFAFLIEASAETLLSVHHIVTMFVTSRYSYFYYDDDYFVTCLFL